MCCPIPKLEAAIAIDYCVYSFLYEKYGSSIYGILIKLSGGDEKQATFLLTQVFVEVFSTKLSKIETTEWNFAQLLRVVIMVAVINGYTASAVTRLLFAPAPINYNPALTSIGASLS